MYSKLALASSFVVASAKVNVMVFGDSFGDTGPTYQVLQDMFDKQGIEADVQSSAIGGTAACQWASEDDGMQMVEQARGFFPNATNGPDYVWYTMGANDQWQDEAFQNCLKSSKSYDAAMTCVKSESDKILGCTTTMLDNYWKAFPDSKVLQTGYEIPCQNLLCQETFDRVFYRAYCGDNITCANHMGFDFQEYHVASLRERYPNKPYNSISIIGAAQKAAGVEGADVGRPNFAKGAKCEWTTLCCHPKYGTPAGDSWRDAFWDLFFSSEFKGKAAVQV